SKTRAASNAQTCTPGYSRGFPRCRSARRFGTFVSVTFFEGRLFMNSDSHSAPPSQPDGDETLRDAPSLLACNANELAIGLHRPNLWEVTVGTLIDAGSTATKSGKLHLRSVPASSEIARNFGAVLSSREIQVVHLIAEGLSNKQIGA